VSSSASCPHRPPCPGCPRFGETAPAPDAIADLEALCAQTDLPPPTLHGTQGLAHRHRARLAVRGRARSPKIGLFQAGSHRIVDTPSCGVHHPLINEVADHLKRAMKAAGIEPYADKPHRGALRYVQVVVERETERAQVVLVGNGTSPDVLGDVPERLSAALGDRLQGLFFNAQPERSNTIFGSKTIKLAGQDMVHETLGGADVLFPPAAFGQNHLPLFGEAVSRIHDLIAPDQVVAEFYCGVGAMGLGLLERSREVRFNERSPDGLTGLEAGLAMRPQAERERARILPGAAGDRLDALDGADVVLVDPPRKGLDAALLTRLVEDPPQQLIYLACGLPALLRELEEIREAGLLSLRGVEAFDFFPFTGHVETLVWLTRNEEQSAPVPFTAPTEPR